MPVSTRHDTMPVHHAGTAGTEECRHGSTSGIGCYADGSALPDDGQAVAAESDSVSSL